MCTPTSGARVPKDKAPPAPSGAVIPYDGGTSAVTATPKTFWGGAFAGV